jgi:hypothetical protein
MIDPLQYGHAHQIGVPAINSELEDYFRRILPGYDREVYTEMARRHDEYQKACVSLWEVYAAATGETVDSFRGVPGGNPVTHVLRRRLKAEKLMADAWTLMRTDPSVDTARRAWVADYMEHMGSVLPLSGLGRMAVQGDKIAPQCSPQCGEGHTYAQGDCRQFSFGSRRRCGCGQGPEGHGCAAFPVAGTVDSTTTTEAR